MSRTHSILRAALWFAFIAAGLGLPPLYLSRTPTSVGLGLTRVLGWGALAGVGLGVLVCIVCRVIVDERTTFGKSRMLFIHAGLGLFGGAAGAALLDQSRIVERRAVELPIVSIEHRPTGRSDAVQITTMSPLGSASEAEVPAAGVDTRPVRQGDCLAGVVERGWLGGAWVRRYTSGPCSAERGPSATHVIAAEADFASWRWYEPGATSPDGVGRRTDSALPPTLTCHTREGGWLYRCVRSAGATGRVSRQARIRSGERG